MANKEKQSVAEKNKAFVLKQLSAFHKSVVAYAKQHKLQDSQEFAGIVQDGLYGLLSTFYDDRLMHVLAQYLNTESRRLLGQSASKGSEGDEVGGK